MTDLTEFLLARIAEDQEMAMQTEWPIVDFGTDENAAFGYRWDPIRVLADLAAKRRIVEFMLGEDQAGSGQTNVEGVARSLRAITVLRWLALPYADHPDYREEWRL